MSTESEIKSTFWNELTMAGLWSCLGAPVGLILCLIFVCTGAAIPVFPPLMILWCVGAGFGISALYNSFTTPKESLDLVWWGIALGTIGAVIGGILGTLLLPGYGTLLGFAIGSLTGAGVGVGFSGLSYLITRVIQNFCCPSEEDETYFNHPLNELGEHCESSKELHSESPPAVKLFVAKKKHESQSIIQEIITSSPRR